MSETAERPSVRISFRLLMAIALGLAALAFFAGRQIYAQYGGYRPLALVHVPPTMRYRERVELNDAPRVAALRPIFVALDPRGTRLPALEALLGAKAGDAARELAFGLEPATGAFVLVIGLQLQAETGLHPANKVCEVLSREGIRLESSASGCRLPGGIVVREAADGALLMASSDALLQGSLGRPEIGDRLGFSGPSVRGAAPVLEDLAPEARALGALLAAKFP